MVISSTRYIILIIKVIHFSIIMRLADTQSIKTCSDCSTYSSNTGSRKGQYVGSVLTTSLNEDESFKPRLPLLGMSGGYQVSADPKPSSNYNLIRYHNIKPSSNRKKPVQLRERYHPTTFETGTSEISQNIFEGPGQILDSSSSDVQNIVLSSDNSHNSFEGTGEVLQSLPSETQPEVFQDSSSDLSYSQSGYDYGSYGYPYPGYQQPLPFITQTPPTTGKQQETSFGYYYIGRKLWYIPLYFSIYFVLYVGALIIKAVARHKISFPQNLASAVTNSRSLAQADNFLTVIVHTAIEKFSSY